MNLRIRKRAPRGALLVPCQPVEDIEAARPWIVALAKLLYTNRLEGLAANQCDLPYRAFLTDVRGDAIRIFINPSVTIVDYSKEEVVERCSSYNDTSTRYRYAHVIIEATNFSGEDFVLNTATLTNEPAGRRLSAAIQHEMEHLGGCDVTVERMAKRVA